MNTTNLTEQQVALINEMTRVRPVLEPALDYGGNTHDYIDIVNGVVTGQCSLMAHSQLGSDLRVSQLPKQRYLHIFPMGGDLEEIKGNCTTWSWSSPRKWDATA